jgi:transposase-like protein
MQTPRTLHDFYAQFPDEDACWRALRQMRWPQGFVCPRCGGRGSHRLRTRRLEQCRACRYQASPTAGTIFHKTRVPLRSWFLAIFFVGRHKKGISALQLQRDTGLGSYQTAWTMLHKLRSALGHRPEFRLTGLVEADETYIGGAVSGGKRGRGAPNKTLVAGAVEQRQHSAGSVRLAVVPHASKDELGPFVRGVIDASEATVLTDGLPAYGHLGPAGVDHRPAVQGDPARAADILPWIHKVFSNLKTWLRGTFHGVSPKHLPRYLQEFSYRFDRRAREAELFHFVLRRAVRGEPLTYARLTAELSG